MANFCISGQHQEYKGFAHYLVYQTLFASIRNSSHINMITIEGVKDYEYVQPFKDNVGVGYDDDAIVANDDTARKKGLNRVYAMSDYAAGSNLKTQIDTDIASINTSWGSDLTVDKIVYSVRQITNYGTELYGAPWLKTETDSVVTTDYDKVKAAGDKVIHVTWDDTSDSNSHWLKAMARYELMAGGESVNWDERKKAYARNRLAINHPTGDNDYSLNIDKILDKDETEYANLCTFLGVSELSSATWKTYVDTYLSFIA